jgi:hypothetical protein
MKPNPQKNHKKSLQIKPIHFVITALLLFIFSTIVVEFDGSKKPSKTNIKNPLSLQRLVSPKGEAILVNIKIPDKTFKKEGEFKVILKTDNNEDTEDYISKIKEILIKYKKVKEKELSKKDLNLAPWPWREVTENGQNFVHFTFREVGSFTSKGKKVLTQISTSDEDGNPYKGWVGRGAYLKVSADIVPYYNKERGVGVSLRLKAIQFLGWKPKNGKPTNPIGFTVVEEVWTDRTKMDSETISNIDENTNSAEDQTP